MAKSLEQILGSVPLTKAIKATSSGIPQPLPPKFLEPTEKFIGNKAKYVRYTGERRTAKLSKYGAPARRANLRDVGEVDVKLLHVYEELPLDPLTLKYLRAADSYQMDMGMQEVSRQVEAHAKKFLNTRVAATLMALRTGILYWGANGDLLPSSSGAVESHSFQMNANNQNQLNSIITASWALASTDIPAQLRALKKRAARLTGYPLKYALYGENIPSYLTQNDYVLDYLARNPTQNADFLQSNEIGTLFGYTWVPVYEAFYEDADGTNQDLWGADSVVFTPEPSDDWWGVFEGSYEVPTTLNVVNDAAAAMRSMSTVHGMFGYSVPTSNPPTITSYYGDTFIPALKIPDVVFQADVTP